MAVDRDLIRSLYHVVKDMTDNNMEALGHSLEELRIGPFRISHDESGGSRLGRGALERIRLRLELQVQEHHLLYRAEEGPELEQPHRMMEEAIQPLGEYLESLPELEDVGNDDDLPVNYPKGDSDLFHDWMRLHHVDNVMFPIESMHGSRQYVMFPLLLACGSMWYNAENLAGETLSGNPNSGQCDRKYARGDHYAWDQWLQDELRDQWMQRPALGTSRRLDVLQDRTLGSRMDIAIDATNNGQEGGEVASAFALLGLGGEDTEPEEVD